MKSAIFLTLNFFFFNWNVSISQIEYNSPIISKIKNSSLLSNTVSGQIHSYIEYINEYGITRYYQGPSKASNIIFIKKQDLENYFQKSCCFKSIESNLKNNNILCHNDNRSISSNKSLYYSPFHKATQLEILTDSPYSNTPFLRNGITSGNIFLAFPQCKNRFSNPMDNLTEPNIILKKSTAEGLEAVKIYIIDSTIYNIYTMLFTMKTPNILYYFSELSSIPFIVHIILHLPISIIFIVFYSIEKPTIYDYSDEYKGITCTICISIFEKGSKIRVLDCKHPFHAGCIREWFRHSLQCPNCRHISI